MSMKTIPEGAATQLVAAFDPSLEGKLMESISLSFKSEASYSQFFLSFEWSVLGQLPSRSNPGRLGKGF